MLTLISNRDEFYHRPSQTAHYWETSPKLFGGKDLEKGGTWLAISDTMRFAAVTNFRRPDKKQYPLSRGFIPTEFLKSNLDATTWSEGIKHDLDKHAGFNAILFDGKDLIYLSNRSKTKVRSLPEGLFGLSNHVLDTPWPKVRRAKLALRKHLEIKEPQLKHQKLLKEFRNDELANDYQLPDTGVGIQIERMLSPMFIESPSYGTRTSTAVSIYRNGEIHFTERNYCIADEHREEPNQRFDEKDFIIQTQATG